MAEQDQPLLRVRGLKTQFAVREGTVRAVDGVDLTIRPGETLCVVGESGCGKSITGRSIMQLVDEPGRITAGEIWFRTRSGVNLGPAPGSGLRRAWRRNERRPERSLSLSKGKGDDPQGPSTGSGHEAIDLAPLPTGGPAMRAIRGKEISMIFQEPMASLSPVHTIGRQLTEMIMLHERLSAAEAKDRAIDALRRVGLPSPEKRFDAYSFELSGGMRQRAMIAMAIVCEPQLLIADEPTTALDVTTQRQILDLLRRMQDELGMAMMFITHDLGVVAEIADRVAVMYLGMVIEECDVHQLFASPRHPYTRALLASIPDLEATDRQRLSTIRGTVPHPLNRPDGCPFVTRCDHAIDDCSAALPSMIDGAAGARPRGVRCVHYPDAAAVDDGIGRDLDPAPHAEVAS
ncbi:ABC transporter ATP-binding protein [Microlunatus parietis]|uniref:Peptide/nickel transport system ATP-binding protein n=1 Tax=Microlunatus parietis TaxID=682979 RepID=A0A7Y9LFM4_9ACTN|nr:ABC transporter ATP-binding protein [Microlunatus parietis]NYE75135.1 peptide/nickel transport system ATP-binding protein [Microlunatus parietis]